MNTTQLLWLIAGLQLLILAALLLGRISFRKKAPTELERFSREMAELNRIFKTPHLRGAWGETLLEDQLSTWLPPQRYSLQYGFSSGQRADAVIRLQNLLVPVDSKFPLESCAEALSDETKEISGSIRRAVLKHAEAISSKYIRPNEGTLAFALMYLPSEKLYHRLFLQSPDLLNQTMETGVVPVGPSGLFLYLQTVAFGLKGLKTPEEYREIQKELAQTGQTMDEIAKSWSLTETHYRNFRKSFETTGEKLQTLRSRISKISR